MKKKIVIVLASAILLSGCDAIKSFILQKSVDVSMDAYVKQMKEYKNITEFQPAEPDHSEPGRSSGMYSSGDFLEIEYSGHSDYNIGDQEYSAEKINSLAIKWFSGDIVLSSNSENKVILAETADKPLEEYQKIRSRIYEGSFGQSMLLDVKYAQAGKHPNARYQKKLSVSVPPGQFESIELSASSGRVEFEEIKVNNQFTVEDAAKVSGKITAPSVRLEPKGDLDVSLNGLTFCYIHGGYAEGDSNSRFKIAFDAKSASSNCNIEKHNGEIVLMFPEGVSPNLKIVADKENVTSDLPYKIITKDEASQDDNTILVEAEEGKVTIQTIKNTADQPEENGNE